MTYRDETDALRAEDQALEDELEALKSQAQPERSANEPQALALQAAEPLRELVHPRAAHCARQGRTGAARAHPRVRGDNASTLAAPTVTPGTSPRARDNTLQNLQKSLGLIKHRRRAEVFTPLRRS
jgi:hypothetical protein